MTVNMTNKRSATEIIASRDKLSKDITYYWNIIAIENVVDRGYKRKYDIKALLAKIQEMANLRAKEKLNNMCVNLCYNSPSEFPKDSIYPTIFRLSEVNEQFVKLGGIKTISPKEKNTKKGKSALSQKEELTFEYIARLRNELSLEIISLKKKIADFNAQKYLDETKTFLFLAA